MCTTTRKYLEEFPPSSLNIRRTFGRCAGPSLRLGRASVMSVARQPWSASVCFCLFSGGCCWWWLVLRLVPRRLFSFKLCRTAKKTHQGNKITHTHFFSRFVWFLDYTTTSLLLLLLANLHPIPDNIRAS